MKNAIKKGTFIGALLTLILGAFSIELDPVRGVVVSLVSGAYLITFYLVNRDRWRIFNG